MADHLEGDALVEYRVDQARKAHAHGLVLMRVNGKVPIGKGWHLKEPPSAETAEKWARLGNLGLRTGQVSNVICIDDDTPDQSAATTLGLPTQTPTIITGRGRSNRLYRLPAGVVIGNSVKTLAPGVDVRGEHGMVVFPGSIHPDTHEPYTWAEGLSPDDVAFAELPPELVEQLLKKGEEEPPPPPKAKSTKPKGPGRQCSKYAKAALRNAVQRMATSGEGSRNDTLNKEAFGLGRLVGAGWLHEGEVRHALASAARSTGLSDAEIENTLNSGLPKGIAKPVNESVLNAPRETGTSFEVSRLTILMLPGELSAIVTKAETALITLGRERFYERAGMPVRLVRSATAVKKHGIRRPEGALSLVLIEPPYLVESFMAAAIFQVYDDQGEIKDVDCPEKIARYYLARRGRWRIDHLHQVIEVPIMRADGTLLQHDGYDAATELYLESGGLVLPLMPAEPTREDALAALEVLKQPVKDFPFLEPSDRSAALAAILTTLARPTLPTAPLFAFRAPKMSSGKSLLADVVAMIATGRVAPVMSPGKDDEEMRKRITAFLLAGFSMGCIDNIEQPFGGEPMCIVLTQQVWRDRILGKSEMATLPTGVTWTATGNNLQFVGDITSRVVPCDLDPRVENPEARSFAVDLYKYVPAHRAALVAAGLTILRAYQIAGRPDQKLEPVRFADWSNMVRDPLVWLGEADPCAGMARLRSVDPVREQIALVLTKWHELFAERAVTAGEVLARAAEVPGKSAPFLVALEEVCRGEGAALDGRRLGHWLIKHERRIEAGLQVVRMGQKQGTTLWSVRPVGGPPVGCVASVGSAAEVGAAAEMGAPSTHTSPKVADGAAAASKGSPATPAGDVPCGPEPVNGAKPATAGGETQQPGEPRPEIPRKPHIPPSDDGAPAEPGRAARPESVAALRNAIAEAAPRHIYLAARRALEADVTFADACEIEDSIYIELGLARDA